MAIRLIDIGMTSGIRSQTIYHGLGYSFSDNTPNTIVLVRPADPYVCIGYFQDAEKEINIEYCKAKGLPIIRRETGGGAGYIDKNQLFIQWVFKRNVLPASVQERFEYFVKPIIETYKSIGISAYYYPINDVHVDGKKIVGTGAGGIGEAEIVTGNFIFDFDYEAMSNVLKVPGEKFKNDFSDGLKNFVTTIKRETHEHINIDSLKHIYIKACEKNFKEHLVLGELTEPELIEMRKLDKKMLSDKWLYHIRKPDSFGRIAKIHTGMWLAEVDHQTADGEVKVSVKLKDEKLSEMQLEGRFNKKSALNLNEISEAMEGSELNKHGISDRIHKFLTAKKVSEYGFTSDDWIMTFIKIGDLRRGIS